MGPNGCRKTTLMKILAGVMQDYEGEVRLFGKTPGAETKAFTSYLPDSSLLADNLTPRAAIRQYQDFFTDFDSAKAYEMVDFFRLPADRKLSAMSKGMRKKLQVALIMSRNAHLCLYCGIHVRRTSIFNRRCRPTPQYLSNQLGWTL